MCYQRVRSRRQSESDRGDFEVIERPRCYSYPSRPLGLGEGYEVPVSSGRPDVDRILKRDEPTYITYRTSSIFITTFNVASSRPETLDGLPGWLTAENMLPPDFYIIGIQEMELSPQSFFMHVSVRQTEWKLIIAKSFPSLADYDLVREVRFVGLFLAIYRRVGSRIKIRPAEIDVVLVPTERSHRLTARLSRKGAIAISMNMNETRVCFVNSHLAAHLFQYYKRVQDYRKIASCIWFSRNRNTLFDHDAVFWFGDLNFRLDTTQGLSNDELRVLCADDNAFRDMIVFDELKRAIKLNDAFKDFNEPEVLNFRPTFKYDRNTDDWDSSPKHRAPAWCDRILWWKQDSVRIRQKFYDSKPSIKFSDHRPVRALFYMAVRTIDLPAFDRAYIRAYKEADRRLGLGGDREEGEPSRE